MNIETNYPELYRNLDENSVKLPENKHALMDKKAL